MTGKEELEARDKLLDEYENNTCLPGFRRPGEPEELESYLIMDRSELEALSVDECGYIAYRLGQFSFHIQRAQNRELARVSWAKNQINITTATEMQNYKGYGREEKLWQAIRENEYARKLNQIQIFAEQRAARLNFISSGINNLAELIKSIKFNKMKADRNDR